jgi:ribonuclease D
VAQKLVASSGDLELIAADDRAEVPALSGWRREMFGEEALKLKQGKLALTAAGKRVKIIEI